MPWVCINYGWENENDERVGLEEPLCVRCREPREDPDEAMDAQREEALMMWLRVYYADAIAGGVPEVPK